ncbi:hypothetical protein HCUR_01582 [Holospora curviuscula]|uniref:Uncharacterized protein n=1 Tax=Holospora curviuscula TaxID=1082868 RepID=A0A2S5R6N2_9PROT|nr:hypothetical protein HCUR_01582 [Holospora curviuscula]
MKRCITVPLLNILNSIRPYFNSLNSIFKLNFYTGGDSIKQGVYLIHKKESACVSDNIDK